MKKVFFKSFVLFMSILVLCTFSFPAMAEDSTLNDQQSSLIAMSQETKIISNDRQVNNYNRKIIEGINSNTLNLNIDQEYLDFSNAKLVEHEASYDTQFVTVPVIGDDYSILSNVTVAFNKLENNIVYFSESYLKQSNSDTFQITNYYNGEEVVNEITDEKYISNEEMKQGIEELNLRAERIAKGLNVACFVAVAGAGATVAGIIGKLCATPCAALIPLCTVCIGAVCVIGGGTIVYAAVACWK